jgi:hypothetical protein
METRNVTTAFGRTFDVPGWIQRLDTKRTHGWQLRYGAWTMFSDHTNDGSGSRRALQLARAELKKRMQSLPALNKIKYKTSAHKCNKLPVGISANERVRKGRKTLEYYLLVSFPRFGERSTTKSVYVGTENTYTEKRFKQALAKAEKIRAKAITEYTRQHQSARVKQGEQL